jgi:hypothetical protein
MELNEAIALGQQFVNTREQHCYYERAVEFRNVYRALVTGENAEFLLKRFVRREDEEAFQQRVDLTISITPSVCAALMKPFNKALRNNNVKKSFDFGTATRNEIVQKMRMSFYGRKRSNNKGLDYWLKTRYPILQFTDPNAWVVIEWDTPNSAAQVVTPRPFEVPSCDAWNWNVENEETRWLWVHNDITFNKLQKAKKQPIAEARAAGLYDPTTGDKFTLYDEDYTVQWEQVDKEYLKAINYQLQPGEELYQAQNKTYYIQRVFDPKLGFAPCFRVGYVSDVETDGETCVNGWHDAMPYLMKSIKTVSEMDLTMSLHAFPQKMQYVQRCPGEVVDGSTRKCNLGKGLDGKVCGACKGVGFKVHTTAQDALYFPMPDTGTPNNEILDLDKTLVYKSPPVDLLTFQKAFVEYLKIETKAAVFGESQQTKTSAGASPVSGSGQSPITATEVRNNMQGTYDALFPFSEKYSDVWIDIIYTFGRIAGTPESADPKIICIFPTDFKMKTIDELLADLQLANASGAPSFLIDQINKDIAAIVNDGDEIAQLMYEVKHKFFPFNGQSPDVIAMNMASSYVSTDTKVLYANFESIFSELDLDNPGFWMLSYDQQVPLVDEMVQAYRDDIAEDNALALNLGNNGMGDTPPAGGDGNGGDGNPAPEPQPAAEPNPQNN